MDVLVFFFADLTVPAAVSLGVGVAASVSVPVLLLPDAHRSDFPRLWQAAVDARHDVAWGAASARHELAPYAACLRRAVHEGHELARDAAALLLLLTTSPKGQLR